jgi:hypothetical protein
MTLEVDPRPPAYPSDRQRINGYRGDNCPVSELRDWGGERVPNSRVAHYRHKCTCLVCKREFFAARASTLTCSNRCRKARSRAVQTDKAAAAAIAAEAAAKRKEARGKPRAPKKKPVKKRKSKV